MSPAAAQKHYENGLRLLKAGKLPEAEAAIAEAIALNETNADYWIKLGLIWAKQNRYQESRDANQMAATLEPTNADAFYNMGLAKVHMGETDGAVQAFEKSFSLNPKKELAVGLGELFYGMNNNKLAAYYYFKARQIDGNDAELQGKLARALFKDGDTVGAVILYIDLVSRYPTNRKYISALVDIYRKFNHSDYSPVAHKVLLTCLSTENVKYRHLGPAWASLFLMNPDLKDLRALGGPDAEQISLTAIKDQLGEELTCLGLRNVPVLNIEAEKILTGIRRYFLTHLDNAASWPKEAIDFLSSLAVQSWYNDFVFYETPEEKALLEKLEATLKQITTENKSGDVAEACLFALYGCYRPLYTIKKPGDKLPLPKNILYDMKPLIKAQIQNPEREAEIIPTIPSFTEITDDISQAVRQMYEQRPYPRWKSTSMEELPAGVGELSKGIQILVAGCGTGQEPALYANSMPYARTTAVDLSLASIAYGKRMAEEIGYLSKIDFMQGDLMEVAKIGRMYDLVVSSGVLHHLKDPDKGLKAILSTMKPGGRINFLLYSQIARDFALNGASAYIKERGFSSSTDDIRRFRHEVINLPDDHPARRCIRASDFFMLSECNDLLFHVQEHRFTFPKMRELAENNGLELIHVYLSPPSQKKWQEMYGEELALDYDKLHAFEEANPDTFLEMYKMYFKRKGDTSVSPLDHLIKGSVI